MERPEHPFKPGDIVVMNDRGFITFNHGDMGVVVSLNWGTTVDEWCILVRHLVRPKDGRSYQQGYRASRFKLVSKGANMRQTYLICELKEHQEYQSGEITMVPDIDTVQEFIGTQRETETAVANLLAVNPHKEYVFGRLDIMAKVEKPPVVFNKI